MPLPDYTWSFLAVPGVGGVRYRERVNATEVSYTGQTWRLRRTFDVDWTNRFFFIKLMLGYSEVVSDAFNFKYIRRVPPQPYLESAAGVALPQDQQPQEYFLFATSVENVEGVAPRGVNDGTAVGEYELARVTVGYESLTYHVCRDDEVKLLSWRDRSGVARTGFVDYYSNPADVGFETGSEVEPSYVGRYVTRQWQPSASYFTLPIGKYFFVGVTQDGRAVPAATGSGKIVPTMEVTYTWHQVPSGFSHTSQQVKSILRYVGCVNRYYFDHFPPGTLLLTGVSSRPYRMTSGGFAHDIMLSMRYRNQLTADGTQQIKSSGVHGTPNHVDEEAAGHNWYLQFSEDFVYEYRKVASAVGADGKMTADSRTPFDYVDFRKIFDINNA